MNTASKAVLTIVKKASLNKEATFLGNLSPEQKKYMLMGGALGGITGLMKGSPGAALGLGLAGATGGYMLPQFLKPKPSFGNTAANFGGSVVDFLGSPVKNTGDFVQEHPFWSIAGATLGAYPAFRMGKGVGKFGLKRLFNRAGNAATASKPGYNPSRPINQF